ncbi:hypothetical protein SDC9_173371 [bioreactor metagenome]|uniref:Uncharacterized protein n=1 Tax=bioreactor metagenome TaxID=1076179 RepID=A0A645GIJ3_9ZZZZ
MHPKENYLLTTATFRLRKIQAISLHKLFAVGRTLNGEMLKTAISK